ncbi:hypothetical protein DD238_006358 [Peronospora effusa]|uniref:Uncharacterized protein n=1 Tax=Peronospora effusa TaxID=542832 RepID=A0A3M6VG01_9STRA|nr:hypothetical protein DD238_006358 [Peronospora effusa]
MTLTIVEEKDKTIRKKKNVVWITGVSTHTHGCTFKAVALYVSLFLSLYLATFSSTRPGSRCINLARCLVHMALVIGIFAPATMLLKALGVANAGGIWTGGITTRRSLEKLNRERT